MERIVAGWLVIHTEGTEHTSFELVIGKNIIGRKTPNYSPDIALDDVFASRVHANIIVKINENNFYEYYVADNETINNGKPSMNGTFVNGSNTKLGEKPQQIIDGDTIQVGQTKLVLKAAKININVEEAIRLVKKQEYQTTVDFVNQSKLSKKF